jgi:DNA polymerase-3 subunit alpha
VEAILSQTYGIMVYQEQVMQMAQIIGGYSLGGADLLRRAMGKKKPEEMAKHRIVFQEGAARNGLSAAKADEIFDLMEKFAGYGFNKSHAAAYALISYQTAWLKVHHRAQFMAAVLSSDMDNTDKVVAFLNECRSLGLQVLPPHVNASGHHFEAIDTQSIRYGLGAIKGVGASLCSEIARLRESDGAYHDLLDFCQRLGPRVNRRVHEILIDAGALDGLGPNRASMRAQLPDILRTAERVARDRDAGQVDLFGASAQLQAPVLPAFEPLPDLPLLERLKAEHAVLGHYVSGHPIDPYREYLDGLLSAPLGEADALLEQNRYRRGNEALVLLAGQVMVMNRRGEDRLFFALDDGSGRIEVVAYADALQASGQSIVPDAILVLEGSLQEDRFSGGTGLRLRRAWAIEDYCSRYAARLQLTLDSGDASVGKRLLDALAPWRPGTTPLAIQVLTPTARGVVDGNAGLKLRTTPELVERLRELPGVRSVKLKLTRPRAESG